MTLGQDFFFHKVGLRIYLATVCECASMVIWNMWNVLNNSSHPSQHEPRQDWEDLLCVF
jgi:hypothetical protein